ncbi:MAG: TIGR02646 family protein [Desulfobulbaceae bacterium]|nr:TIGR02646 family protein [Desulfobulbaceae bacterium]
MTNEDSRCCYEETRQALFEEQHGLCCYCEREIAAENKKNSVEHLEPRSSNKTRVYDYANLALSCTKSDHCNNYRGNEYDAGKFSSPHDPVTKSLFRYMPHGLVVSSGVDDDKADYLIKTLQLNCASLLHERRSHAKRLIESMHNQAPEVIDALRKSYLCPDDKTGYCQSFPSLSQTILLP